eukprot:340518-Rhodomonas_salina.2
MESDLVSARGIRWKVKGRSTETAEMMPWRAGKRPPRRLTFIIAVVRCVLYIKRAGPLNLRVVLQRILRPSTAIELVEERKLLDDVRSGVGDARVREVVAVSRSACSACDVCDWSFAPADGWVFKTSVDGCRRLGWRSRGGEWELTKAWIAV